MNSWFDQWEAVYCSPQYKFIFYVHLAPNTSFIYNIRAALHLLGDGDTQPFCASVSNENKG